MLTFWKPRRGFLAHEALVIPSPYNYMKFEVVKEQVKVRFS